MAVRFNLAYYYVSPDDLARIDSFRECSGDSEKTLVTQYVRGFLSNHRVSYFEPLARYDAHTRSLSLREWGELITSPAGVEALPPHKMEVNFTEKNPLSDIKLAPNCSRRNINYITLGLMNTAFLRIGIYYDRDNAVNYISRIVKEHLDRNWVKRYEAQVKMENWENWQ
jgi:hypothetical protein